MNKNSKVIVGVVSVLLIIMISITVGMKTKEKKDNGNREIEIKYTCPPDSAFPDAIEKYYEDDNYICTLNQIKSGCYVVKVNGKEYPLKDALNNKVITVEEGIEHGLYCEKNK